MIRIKPLLARIAVALALTMLAGCSIYQSIGKSTGSFLHAVSGPDFVHIDNQQWNRDNALIYFYRNPSQWAADEIEAPSVYVDDRHYFNIRNGSYTWLEVSPGTRQVAMRRPLMGLEGIAGFNLSLIADATFRVEPGKIYYLRYNELKEPESANPALDADDPLSKGDLQLVTRAYAMKSGEIVSTRFLNSDMLAPNHAATSIVAENEKSDYKRDMEQLAQEREAEIERLKAQGLVKKQPWYWPFGSDPSVPLETDKKIAEREQAYAALQTEREYQQQLQAKAADSWWAFWK